MVAGCINFTKPIVAKEILVVGRKKRLSICGTSEYYGAI